MGPDEQKVDARLAVVQPAVAKEGPQENSAVERAQQEIAERVHSFAHPCSFLHLFHHEVTFCGGFDHARETSDLWEIALSDNTADHFVDHHDNPKHDSPVHLAVVSLHARRSDPWLSAMEGGRSDSERHCAS